ncbi:nitrilase-related carbon-nitrogen hydrolase [Umezawaea sp. Da 62-37]|uniref:nitrilase-related carbon-nitrogen hydrolase n=1 Tax=Umezawaea sp. Da 62-37 TaxID=3075927 RepID=UPI0028F6E868|nr:nitrilase-related carbon-nitrogen hydrolase [Umezawaea sp. Da 62-37]WNV89070.1 nitrilase-related carbon-nitrogen hydrolase [Umezawaea sp. Da 62-37]
MVSARNRAGLAVVATAALYFFGTGLHPVPWLTWLAPLPILLLAPAVSTRTAAATAFAAYLLGGSNVWHYYAVDLELPPPLLLPTLVLFPLLLTGATLLFRAALLRGHALVAAAVFPAGIAGAEYVVSLATPAGANWSLAPTQADLLPVLQIASLTGGWGVSFLVAMVPAVIAVASGERRAAVAGILLLGLASGYGFVRLATVDSAAVSPRITLLSARTDRDEVRMDTPAGHDLAAAYVDWLGTAPDDGTRIVVLSEKGFQADDTTLPTLLDPLSAAARARGVDVVVGVKVKSGGTLRNVAYYLSGQGAEPVVYVKNHLVPGLEDAFTAGTDLAFAPGRVGIAVCADLGHPAFGRAYGRAGAGLLVVPALDFTVDAWSQSRVQLLRGVESGFSVARAAHLGYLTLSDPTGRVVAQAATGSATPFVAVSGTLPMPEGGTFYARWGDWFAWLCLLLVVGYPTWCRSRSGRRSEVPASGGP